MMITWQLWQALNRPPITHRLFQRTRTGPSAFRPPVISGSAVLGGILLITIVAFVSRDFSSMIALAILVIIPLATLQFILTGPIHGLRWAAGSARAITRLRRSGSYDLLCMTPPGTLNIHWIVSAAVFHRSMSTFILSSRSLWPTRMSLALPLVIYLTAQMNVMDQPLVNVLVMSLYLASLILWFIVEDTQSVVLGGLLSMLLPTYTHDEFETHVSTIATYLLIQISIYTLVILLLSFMLPSVYSTLGLHGWLADVSRPTLALAVLSGIREGVLYLLWQRLLDRLNAGPETSLLMGYRT